MQYKIQILMSTYNGEKYIDEQIQSILAQENVHFHLLIRDDGSTDRTRDILARYSRENPEQISYYQGVNLGVVGSFFDLMERSANDCDFYAFCDQDDVWDSKKLYQAINKLAEHSPEKPLLYCSPTRMVTETMQYIKSWPGLPKRPLTLYNSLIENVAVGCTMVINQSTLRLINEHRPKCFANVIMHDWWIYVCVSAFGDIIFDDHAYIQYRQHSNNVLGGQTDTWVIKWKKRLVRFLNGKNHYILSKQAEEFIKCFDPLIDTQQKEQIQKFLDIISKRMPSRARYVLNCPFYRQVFMDNVLFKVVYIAGKV